MNLYSSVTDKGGGILHMASTFDWSILIPLWSKMWPKYLTEDWQNTHFSLLNLRLIWSARSRTFYNRSLCSSSVLPYIRKSSIIILTPSISPKRFIISVIKISDSALIPKVRRVTQYLPKGVFNVQSFDNASISFNIQKPLLASKVVKNFAPDKSAFISSRVANW